MVNKNFYNTVLSQAFTPCGNYLLVGDIYGQISVFHLSKIINPDLNSSKNERLAKNVFVVEEDIQINSLVTTDNFLIVGTVGCIYGYQWKVVKTSKDTKPSWKIDLPNRKENLEKGDINCMVYNKELDVIYVGCGDNNIYVIKVEGGAILQTLSGHTDYIHSICYTGNELVSGGEDGLVNVWDTRSKLIVSKIEPHKQDKLARPDLGKWIGAVCLNEDWLLCGGGPRLALWHMRTLNTTTIFPIENRGVHVAEFYENNILAGGTAEYFHQMSFNGDMVSEIPVSSVTVYSAVYHNEPFTTLCIAGSSPKIDICSNFNYRDQKSMACNRSRYETLASLFIPHPEPPPDVCTYECDDFPFQNVQRIVL